MSTSSIPATSQSLPGNLSSPVTSIKRYHPLLVALHWLIAILIFGTVLLVQGNEGERGRFQPGQGNFPRQGQGFQQGNPPQNFQSGNPGQGFQSGNFPRQGEAQNPFSSAGIHMIIGVAILVLLIVRLIVRWTTKHPDWASAGSKLFDWVGVLTHWGLYLLTFAMTITGIVLAVQRGELARTFGIGTFSPGNFRRGGFNIGFLHGGVWTLLLFLIVLHIGAALYHQFIVKDNLLARMWFGERTAE